MVSEYVGEIFAYLKEVEVGESLTAPPPPLTPTSVENDHA